MLLPTAGIFLTTSFGHLYLQNMYRIHSLCGASRKVQAVNITSVHYYGPVQPLQGISRASLTLGVPRQHTFLADIADKIMWSRSTKVRGTDRTLLDQDSIRDSASSWNLGMYVNFCVTGGQCIDVSEDTQYQNPSRMTATGGRQSFYFSRSTKAA